MGHRATPEFYRSLLYCISLGVCSGRFVGSDAIAFPQTQPTKTLSPALLKFALGGRTGLVEDAIGVFKP